MKIGIIGAGGIATVMANTLAGMEQMTRYAIASRSLEKAQDFARQYGFEKAYGSYEALVSDPDVELVYIATPHSQHYENMMLCITHEKPVLCEKAFTMNARQARAIAQAAKEHKVYVAEAIWPRYMPSRQIINELLDSGLIGKVSTLTANLSYPISHVPRLVRPELAGGALLDIGVYGINFALMHFGKEIERIETAVRMTDTGVDSDEVLTLFYTDGRMAVLTHSIYARSDRKGIFHGDKGYIVVENINNPSAINVYDRNDQLLGHVDIPAQITGYEYEVEESANRILQGATESTSMPLEETIYMMDVMDSIRKQWGMVYPGEEA
ncbi:MAG: Gfo/Idh/MocA family oxidoreductase [Lachnospiraceae bacterium]|nr:Gfo/Idh/MocA family oxidoreductase [Lachnospiraceae bacterium]